MVRGPLKFGDARHTFRAPRVRPATEDRGDAFHGIVCKGGAGTGPFSKHLLLHEDCDVQCERVNRRLPVLLRWLEERQPDVVVL